MRADGVKSGRSMRFIAYGEGSGKRILRLACADLLPKGAVTPRKHGFELPIASWLRQELRPLFQETVRRDVLLDVGLLNPAAVDRLVHGHACGYDTSRWSGMPMTVYQSNRQIGQAQQLVQAHSKCVAAVRAHHGRCLPPSSRWWTLRVRWDSAGECQGE